MPLVYIDPGHGGRDTSNGSPDGKYKEHEFSVDVGRRLRSLLLEQGVAVGMTHEATFEAPASLQARAQMANQAGADLFVSLHTNAAAGTGAWHTASGLVVYTYAPGGVRDELAKAILKRMGAAGVKLFGQQLYHAKFAVLKYTSMPAVLIEYGFHDNQADVELLRRIDYRQKLAEATAQGICDQLGVTWRGARRYSVVLGTLDSLDTAKAVVANLAEIGIEATIKEEST